MIMNQDSPLPHLPNSFTGWENSSGFNFGSPKIRLIMVKIDEKVTWNHACLEVHNVWWSPQILRLESPIRLSSCITKWSCKKIPILTMYIPSNIYCQHNYFSQYPTFSQFHLLCSYLEHHIFVQVRFTLYHMTMAFATWCELILVMVFELPFMTMRNPYFLFFIFFLSSWPLVTRVKWSSFPSIIVESWIANSWEVKVKILFSFMWSLRLSQLH